jgi:inorganic pyrophosphatase/K(+)-stimulated pyrophosphate-energized sodium pump
MIVAVALLALAVTPVFAQSATVPSVPDSYALPLAYWLAPLGAILGLVMAYVFYGSIMKHTEGDENMVRIAQAVREGAYAYLTAQRAVVIKVFIGLVIVLLIVGFGLHLQPKLTPLGVGLAGFLSGLCGWFGMRTATNASARTTAGCKESLNQGLRIAFRAGAVMGLCVTGFALLDVSFWFFVLTQIAGVDSLVTVTTITLSFAMGASLQALFARVGGGIYTKAADVGADLVGKVEAGIPEDDARNPATIADNVGDNVGDVAGMGADLYESYYGSILAAMALAAAAAFRLDMSMADSMKLVCLPPALAGLGIIASVISIFVVRTKEGATMAQLLKSLHGGVWFSSALIVVGSLAVIYFLLGDVPVKALNQVGLWIAIVAGLAAGLIIAWGTEYYTSYEHKPTQRIAKQAETGPATVIISGIAEGMVSTWIPLLVIVVAIMVSFIAAGGNDTFLLGVFGVGIAAVGMLSTLGITLATDAYGPIADNAGGNAEMTHQEPYVRERTDMLDSLGNTTAATGKGFAIGSAALTALALLAAYITTVQASLSQQAEQEMVAVAGADVVDAGRVMYIERLGLVAIQFPDGSYDAGLIIGDAQHQVSSAHRIDAAFAGLHNDDVALSTYTQDIGPGAVMGEPGGAASAVPGLKLHDEVVHVVAARYATLPQIMGYYDVTLMNPKVLCGLFLGVMLVFVFCSMTMNAVGRAAFAMMRECRRQFGIMKGAFKAQGMSDEDIADPMKWPFSVEADGKTYPDYANCVAISTAGALKEMIVPSIMAVVVPIIVGLILGVPGVMGLLAGALVCGFAVAIFMANAGGAWDNAKKWIEAGQLGGKGSENHKATVVGDTVGDPFKDTSGPSLNILIKLISVVSVVFCGVVVKFSPIIGAWIGLG